MGLYIVVHKTRYEELKAARNYLCEKLDELYPGKVHSYYDGRFISLKNGISIDLRCGAEPYKLAGLRADYYYTDDWGDVADMLEQSACKCDGKRLKNLGQVVHIIASYMTMKTDIDKMLIGEEIDGYVSLSSSEVHKLVKSPYISDPDGNIACIVSGILYIKNKRESEVSK